jgi:hypothetical protein
LVAGAAVLVIATEVASATVGYGRPVEMTG